MAKKKTPSSMGAIIETVLTPIGDIKPNPENPRVIKDKQFRKLVQSVKDDPWMLKLRPLVVDKDMVVIGGNMRLKACQEAGFTEIPTVQDSALTEEQKKAFIVKDNLSYGEWDWPQLDPWDQEQLEEWGLEVPLLNDKLQVEKVEPEIEITEEILEEHNYVVFTFDNKLDWQVAKELFNIKTVAKDGFTETYMQKGVGRVKKGAELIEMIQRLRNV
jgi:hypothetical protein